MTNTQRAMARIGLIFAALIAGVLNGSVIAAPALMLVAYLLALLVRYGQEAVDKFERERFNRIQEAGAR